MLAASQTAWKASRADQQLERNYQYRPISDLLRISRRALRDRRIRGNIIWLAFNTHLISVEEYPDRKERAQNPAERFIYSQGLHTLFQIHQRIRDFLEVTKTTPFTSSSRESS